MTTAPRHAEIRELSKELKAIESRAEALSLFDYPADMGLYDMIIFALTVYDDPKRQANPEQLRETFAKCGQFGVVAIEGAIMDSHPYLNLGDYNDSLEKLQRDGMLVIGDPLVLTGIGRQVGAAMYSQLHATGKPFVSREQLSPAN